MVIIKELLQKTRTGRLMIELKSTLHRTVRAFPKVDTRYRCDTIRPQTPPKGAVLVSYYNTISRDRFLAREFLCNPEKPLPEIHHMEWMSLQIVRTFVDMGFEVDLISWTNNKFIPKRSYAAFIDVRDNMERLAPLLNKNCVKIVHIDLCHMLYNNYGEARRLLELQQRRGVTLQVRRSERVNLAIENADCATILGNDFAMKTFAYSHKPLYQVPVTCNHQYPAPTGKDVEACRKNFIWIGSGGFVRKGLDLVLEAFAAMPEFQLYICGPIEREPDFQNAYYKELYQTSNIYTLGWLDIGGPDFIDLVSRCLGLVYVSCSEGQCGAVVDCLHAGLIPIISYESGVPVQDFGLVLKNNTISEIQAAVRTVSNLLGSELQKMAQRAWDYARSYHTRDNFSSVYRELMEKLLVAHGKEVSGRP